MYHTIQRHALYTMKLDIGFVAVDAVQMQMAPPNGHITVFDARSAYCTCDHMATSNSGNMAYVAGYEQGQYRGTLQHMLSEQTHFSRSARASLGILS